MALNLKGPQRGKFRNALVNAYPNVGALRRMVSDQFESTTLDAVAGMAGTLEDITYDLISWAGGKGQLGELLLGARASNPKSPALNEFVHSIGLSADRSYNVEALQKFVGPNKLLLDVAVWRTTLAELEYQVGRVERSGVAKGTGFLVGPDLLLTNHHVLESAIDDGSTNGWGVRFDYKTALDQSVSAGTLVGISEVIDHARYSPLDVLPIADRGGKEPGAEHLDYALVRLARKIGEDPRRGEMEDERGWITLSEQAVDFASVPSIAILQHPTGQPLKLATGTPADLQVSAPAGNRVRYTVPTLPSSSGSPVFNGDWELIALHHSSDPKYVNPEYNEAIPVSLIAKQAKVQAALGS